MKKVFRLFLLCSILTTSLTYGFAQNANATLEAARKAIKSGGISSDFQSKMYNNKGSLLANESGNIHIQGEKFRLNYGTITAVYDGRSLVYHDKADNTLTYSKPSHEELAQINPFFFLMNTTTSYNVVPLASNKIGPVVRFSPKIKNGIKNFDITFNKLTKLPQEVSAVFDDLSHMEITVSQINTKQHFAPETFVLKERDYPKAEIIDLR